MALDGFKAAPPAAEADLAPVQVLINEAYQGERALPLRGVAGWLACLVELAAAEWELHQQSSSSGGDAAAKGSTRRCCCEVGAWLGRHARTRAAARILLSCSRSLPPSSPCTSTLLQ